MYFSLQVIISPINNLFFLPKLTRIGFYHLQLKTLVVTVIFNTSVDQHHTFISTSSHYVR